MVEVMAVSEMVKLKVVKVAAMMVMVYSNIKTATSRSRTNQNSHASLPAF